MKMAVGVNFEEFLSSFSAEYSKLAQNLVEIDGEYLSSSQFFTSLGNSNDEIFFITNKSGVAAPELKVAQSLRLFKATFQIKKRSTLMLHPLSQSLNSI